MKDHGLAHGNFRRRCPDEQFNLRFSRRHVYQAWFALTRHENGRDGQEEGAFAVHVLLWAAMLLGVPAQFAEPEACHGVIVDHANSLHERVADCGTHERKTSLLE